MRPTVRGERGGWPRVRDEGGVWPMVGGEGGVWRAAEKVPGSPEEKRKQAQRKQGCLKVHGKEGLRVRLLFKQFLEWEESSGNR